MSIISNDDPRLVDALESATCAFWADIAMNYPDATSNDLSPNETIKLATAMRSAVTEWLQFNADAPLHTSTIMLHRIEYYYRGGHGALLLTDSDKEHIAYCISVGNSEGELCTMLEISPIVDEEVYGYWKINNNPE